jgi:hypothetical protein
MVGLNTRRAIIVVMYIHSRCHSGHWLLIDKGGNLELYCKKCPKPFGLDIKNVDFIGDVLEEKVDDWTFIMPASRTAWEVEVETVGNRGYLSCLETGERFVSFTMEKTKITCDACGKEG